MTYGLGCLRLVEEAALAEAVKRGIPWIDTARVYPGSEALVAQHIPDGAAKVVTKCGMQPGYRPDGLASAILADARASVAALGRPPDLLLLHAPDDAVDLATSARALARAQREGLARAVGLSNVTRGQIERVAGMMEIAGIEVALGPYDDTAARGGIVGWCRDHGVPLLAYSVFGGPKGVARLRRDEVVRRIAAVHGATAEAVMLAYVRGLAPVIVPLVGARTAAQVVVAEVALNGGERAQLDARFPGLAEARQTRRSPAEPRAEAVLLMGIPGAGKSRLARDFVESGYLRLNRDELGGTLKTIARKLGDALASGATRIVLDNTYVSRATRNDVLRIAHAAGAAVRCVHAATSLADAQVNLALRMLERHGALLGGSDLRRKDDPGFFAPPVLHRMHRDLEPPGADEGFAAIETVPFVREGAPGRAAHIVPASRALAERARRPDALLLVYGWREPAPTLDGNHDIALCTHPAGPPLCWCRPPLPGLVLALARRNGVDLRASTFVATTHAERALGAMLGLECQA